MQARLRLKFGLAVLELSLQKFCNLLCMPTAECSYTNNGIPLSTVHLELTGCMVVRKIGKSQNKPNAAIGPFRVTM